DHSLNPTYYLNGYIVISNHSLNPAYYLNGYIVISDHSLNPITLKIIVHFIFHFIYG
ncbi:hypothetical protein KSS87_009073, partial [Heliosperma pusillum]